jgi:hypothetical protein
MIAQRGDDGTAGEKCGEPTARGERDAVGSKRGK